jgi:SAM-dependent methyltransferase
MRDEQARITPRLTRLLIEAAVKHLPPSASQLRLLDINGESGAALADLRADLDVTPIPGHAPDWHDVAENSADAIMAHDYVLNDAFLKAALRALRPGGRLVIVNRRGEALPEIGHTLEQAGYTRILVETAVECPLPTGVLMRGEKPHTTENTLERVQVAAAGDADHVTWLTYQGRYAHLLVVQRPDKPAWKLEPGETITWDAVAINRPSEYMPTLLAFSSLPKAVAFMQPSVLAGRIQGVNKVAKFRREAVNGLLHPVLLNPDPSVLAESGLSRVPVDPAQAERPDE